MFRSDFDKLAQEFVTRGMVILSPEQVGVDKQLHQEIYEKEKVVVLWLSLCCGLFMDLLNTQHTFALFALSYTAGGLRIIGVLSLVLFISFYIRRAFDTKDVDLNLTRPVSRVSFLLSHISDNVFGDNDVVLNNSLINNDKYIFIEQLPYNNKE